MNYDGFREEVKHVKIWFQSHNCKDGGIRCTIKEHDQHFCKGFQIFTDIAYTSRTSGEHKSTLLLQQSSNYR